MSKLDSVHTVDLLAAAEKMAESGQTIADVSAAVEEIGRRVSTASVVNGNLVVDYLPDNEYNPDFRYLRGERCTLGGVSYVAQRPCKGVEPGTNEKVWVAVETPKYTNWNSITDGDTITVGTVVELDGAVYTCKREHQKAETYKPGASAMHWKKGGLNLEKQGVYRQAG